MPSSRARSKSRSAFAHQSHATPLRLPARTCPSASQRDHELSGLVAAPSHWNADVATPQAKPSGNSKMPSTAVPV